MSNRHLQKFLRSPFFFYTITVVKKTKWVNFAFFAIETRSFNKSNLQINLYSEEFGVEINTSKDTLETAMRRHMIEILPEKVKPRY